MFFSITDRDSAPSGPPPTSRQFSWDVYHIENYLLEPAYILRVLKDLLPTAAPATEAEVLTGLEAAANSVVNRLVAHRLRSLANGALIEAMELRFDPNSPSAEKALVEAIDRSKRRIDGALADVLSAKALREEQDRMTAEYQSYLIDGTWRAQFPGRLILGTYCGSALRGHSVKYEHLRDLVVANMQRDRFEPPGMKVVVDRILAEPWR